MNDLLKTQVSFAAVLAVIGVTVSVCLAVFLSLRGYELAENSSNVESRIRTEYRQEAIDETQVQLAQLRVQLTRIEAQLGGLAQDVATLKRYHSK